VVYIHSKRVKASAGPFQGRAWLAAAPCSAKCAQMPNWSISLQDVEKGPLSAAVNVHHRRQLFLRAIWETMDRRHARRLAFERADQKPHMPKDTAILFPLADGRPVARAVRP